MSTKNARSDFSFKQRILIAQPALREKRQRLLTTFNDLMNWTKPEVISTYQDEALFHTPLLKGTDVNSHIYIKLPGSDFVIPRMLENYLPIIRKMIDGHYQKNLATPGQACILIFRQKKYDPARSGRPSILAPHVDARLDRVREGKDPRQFLYAASNIPTPFIDANMKDFTEKRFSISGNIRKDYFSEIAEKSINNIFNFNPGDIVAYDSTTPHGFPVPLKGGFRTFIFLAFVETDFKMNINFLNQIRKANPELAETRPIMALDGLL